ncbi:MAG: class I SAM-dependent methyltransferase [Proteobacteria bacterium]|nr:class I SAM-dependent methyltransferase [Pseudomonadota bacterium]
MGNLGPEDYRRWRASGVGAITEEVERRLILELSGDVAGREALDVGCGDGALALALWRRGARASAVDASPAMIEAAAARARAAGAAIRLGVASIDRLPFADRSFDLVTAVTVLCFVADAGPAFAEMARVLRPGGRLVIGELGKWSAWAAARRLRAWLGSALWRRGRFWRGRELRRLAEAAGLVPEELRGAVFYPRSALAARLIAPREARLGRLTTFGAAFVALAARKPPASSSAPERAAIRARTA